MNISVNLMIDFQAIQEEVDEHAQTEVTKRAANLESKTDKLAALVNLPP